MSNINFRLIFRVMALSIILLIALFAIFIGYEMARSHAIGRYAPIGDPTNFKKK